MEQFSINKSEHWKRQSILIVNNDEYLQTEKILRKEESSGLMVLPIKYYEEFNKNFSLVGLPSIIPGMLIIQSPINIDEYIEITQVRELLTITMVSSIIRLSQYLGAKKIEVETLKVIDKNLNVNFSLDVEKDLINIDKIKVNKDSITFDLRKKRVNDAYQYKSNFINNLKNRIQLSAEFENNEIQKELATNYLKAKRLNTLSFINDYYEMRIAPFPVTDYKLKISTTENLNKTFELLSKINFPSGAINGNYKKTFTENIEILLDIKVDFK